MSYNVEEVNKVTDWIIIEFDKMQLYGSDISVKVEYKCGQYFEKVTYILGKGMVTVSRRITDSGASGVLIKATNIQVSDDDIMEAYLRLGK